MEQERKRKEEARRRKEEEDKHKSPELRRLEAQRDELIKTRSKLTTINGLKKKYQDALDDYGIEEVFKVLDDEEVSWKSTGVEEDYLMYAGVKKQIHADIALIRETIAEFEALAKESVDGHVALMKQAKALTSPEEKMKLTVESLQRNLGLQRAANRKARVLDTVLKRINLYKGIANDWESLKGETSEVEEYEWAAGEAIKDCLNKDLVPGEAKGTSIRISPEESERTYAEIQVEIDNETMEKKKFDQDDQFVAMVGSDYLQTVLEIKDGLEGLSEPGSADRLINDINKKAGRAVSDTGKNIRAGYAVSSEAVSKSNIMLTILVDDEVKGYRSKKEEVSDVIFDGDTHYVLVGAYAHGQKGKKVPLSDKPTARGDFNGLEIVLKVLKEPQY